MAVNCNYSLAGAKINRPLRCGNTLRPTQANGSRSIRRLNVRARATPGDGAFRGVKLGGDVADGSATAGEPRDDGLLFGRGELVVGDAVSGERAFDGDVVDVELGG